MKTSDCDFSYLSVDDKEALIARLILCLRIIAKPKDKHGKWEHNREECKKLAERALDLVEYHTGKMCP